MPTRILVDGVTGSGKSTLAAQLGARLGLPVHAMDDLTWEPGWVEVPKDVQRQRVAAVCAGESWVVDAAYRSWAEIVLDRAELVVALDFPRWVSLSRLLRRTAARILTRDEICNGNRESLRVAFSHNSIVAWHFRSFRRKRERMRAWAAAPKEPAGPEIVLLDSPRAVRAWLRTLPVAAQPRQSGG